MRGVCLFFSLWIGAVTSHCVDEKSVYEVTWIVSAEDMGIRFDNLPELSYDGSVEKFMIHLMLPAAEGERRFELKDIPQVRLSVVSKTDQIIKTVEAVQQYAPDYRAAER